LRWLMFCAAGHRMLHACAAHGRTSNTQRMGAEVRQGDVGRELTIFMASLGIAVGGDRGIVHLAAG
jgi:hypothetical protein